jgi:hypothetical protein
MEWKNTDRTSSKGGTVAGCIFSVRATDRISGTVAVPILGISCNMTTNIIAMICSKRPMHTHSLITGSSMVHDLEHDPLGFIDNQVEYPKNKFPYAPATTVR